MLTGRLGDTAAVYGVIAKLEALGLDLVELRRAAELSRRRVTAAAWGSHTAWVRRDGGDLEFATLEGRGSGAVYWLARGPEGSAGRC